MLRFYTYRLCTSSETKCTRLSAFCIRGLMVCVWNQPLQKLLEPLSRWAAERLCFCLTADFAHVALLRQSGHIRGPKQHFSPLFIMDSVSPGRQRSEPYDTPSPRGNRQINKWYTSMSRVPNSSMSPYTECAFTDFKGNAGAILSLFQLPRLPL